MDSDQPQPIPIGSYRARNSDRSCRVNRNRNGQPRGGPACPPTDRGPGHQSADRLPGATTSSGASGGFGSRSTLTVDDAEAISENAPSVDSSPTAIGRSAQVVYRNRNWSTSVEGVSASYLAVRDWSVTSGRSFLPQEDAAGRVYAYSAKPLQRRSSMMRIRSVRRSGSAACRSR